MFFDPNRKQQIVTVVKERNNRSSFSQLDGEAGETEKEEDIIETWPADPPLHERYKVPPKKVRHPESVYGIGTFERIDQDTGHFLYEFQNGYLVEV